MSLREVGWTIENATACIELYGQRARELESEAATFVHSTYWLEQFARSAECNRREERYCRQVLEALTRGGAQHALTRKLA